MLRHTANYAFTNHNFVIQNISESRVDSEFIPAVCVIKNILQRGKPTLMSLYLQGELGEIHNNVNYNNFVPLLSNETAKWERIIRGDEKRNYNPAKHFFDILIPKYFTDYPYLQQLIVPEVPINFITQIDVDEFQQKQVDFYLPQAFLIIEIDGSQHDERTDLLRDQHLKKLGNQTIRFTTQEIESENELFLEKIDQIKNRITRWSENIDKKNASGNLLEFVPSINDYSKIYQDAIQDSDVRLISTAIIRFQILILDLIEYGHLNLNNGCTIQLKTDFNYLFEQLAINDLKLWFEHILQLQKINVAFPKIEIERVKEFTENKNFCIDFSIKKRYTDEFQNYPHIIYVRSDYFDHHLHYKAADAIKPEIIGFRAYDFYKVSTCQPYKYRLVFQQENGIGDEEAMIFIMKNFYGAVYDKFRDGQLPIIANALSLNSTIGLLPTGGGKSLCFQLPIFLQPGISFVVCPIKSLMFDQKVDLLQIKITRIAHVTSKDDSSTKDMILKDFSDGKYQFIFIAPERFQINSFRQYLRKLRENFTISYAVIDEVHCLSEWGHDFRTSYLNLSKTIRKYCSDSIRFLALTATASLNVLKDIKLELGITDENVKTLTDYSRAELDFEVISDNENKYNTLKSLLKDESEKNQIFEMNGPDSNAGIIFTSTVNGHYGCANIARELTEHFNIKVDFFSGSAPKINGVQQDEKEFEKYKTEVQDKFKSNELPLIVATKAFGMGVNKKNVSYTIHYGIPGSMESLYQEAGRAGRDKERYLNNHARCYVLFSQNRLAENLDFLWDQNTSNIELKQRVNDVDGDLKSNLFMLQNSLEDESIEHEYIKALFLKYASPNKKEVLIASKRTKLKVVDDEGNESYIGNKAITEKAIYRLTQLGIVEDWTVKDFFNGEYVVDFCNYSENTIKDSLIFTISKYSDKNVLDALIMEGFNEARNSNTIDQSIRALLQWVNKHFVYNRRQSLKNIYESCLNYFANDPSGDPKLRSIEFKNALENYFKFSEASFVLQHISENSFDFEKWFEVFYLLQNEGQKEYRTDCVLNSQQLIDLQNNLSRFLESYANNVGLNFISGILRLMNNDFENSDGKNRLEQSFNFLIKNDWDLGKSMEIKNTVLMETCRIVRTAQIEIRNQLASFVIEKIGHDMNSILLINEHLDDEITSIFITNSLKKRLINVNMEIYEQIERIG